MMEKPTMHYREHIRRNLCRNGAREGHTVLSSSEMGVVRGNVDRQAVQTVDPIQGIRLTCTR